MSYKIICCSEAVHDSKFDAVYLNITDAISIAVESIIKSPTSIKILDINSNKIVWDSGKDFIKNFDLETICE